MNELLPVELTDTLDEVSEAAGAAGTCGWFLRRSLRESAECVGARLDVAVGWEIMFQYDAPLTQAEASERLHELLASMLRHRCLSIIRSLPTEVVPAILPQLQDIAEYETRMWQRRTEISQPSIREEWLALPIAK